MLTPHVTFNLFDKTPFLFLTVQYGMHEKSSERYGNMSEKYGNMSEKYGNMSEKYGNMSEMYGNMSE